MLCGARPVSLSRTPTSSPIFLSSPSMSASSALMLAAYGPTP